MRPINDLDFADAIFADVYILFISQCSFLLKYRLLYCIWKQQVTESAHLMVNIKNVKSFPNLKAPCAALIYFLILIAPTTEGWQAELTCVAGHPSKY